MVETRRSASASASASASKRPESSSSASPSSHPLPKRPKVSEGGSSASEAKDFGAEVLDSEARSCDPNLGDAKDLDAEKVNVIRACTNSQPGGEVGPDVEKAPGHKRKSGKMAKQDPMAVWGQLLSQSSQNPHLVMRENLFTVGQGHQCNLCLSDPSISNVLCKIKHIVRGGSSVTLLEITGCKGVVQVNGKVYGRNSNVLLFGGDEVVFSAEGDHSYVFQQFDDNLPYRGLSSECMLEAQSSPMNEMLMENISLSLDKVSRAIVESAEILASKVARPHPSSAVLFTPLHSLNLEQSFLLDCYEYLAKNDAEAEMFLGTHESYRDAMLQRIMKNRM